MRKLIVYQQFAHAVVACCLRSLEELDNKYRRHYCRGVKWNPLPGKACMKLYFAT